MTNSSLKEILFFEDNIIKINKMAEKILLFIIAVPVLFIILTYAGLFNIPYNFSFVMLAASILVCTIEEILLHCQKTHVIAAYYGLISINLLLGIFGAEAHIGVCITYGIIPFISCLYYDKKITHRISIISYIIMIFSLWFKSKTIYLLDATTDSPAKWFWSNFAGFSMEYFIVFLVARGITNRTTRTMSHLINSIKERNAVNQNLEETQLKIIEFVSKCLGSHDLFTGQHVVHTRKYVELICNALVKKGLYTEQLTPENIELYSSAAFLHDTGKIHIPEGVLNKLGRFTEDEFDLMKNHPEEGRKLLEYLPKIGDGSFNTIATQMAYTHHEKWNGTGYPNNLSGDDIPLCGRIMACADVLDALISKRLYKEPMTIEEAMNVFEESKGSHFEPCIADAVIENKELIRTIDANFKSVESQNNMAELSWWIRYHENLNKKAE